MFVVDDHPIVRQGLTLLINREADLVVCGEAEEMHSALQRDSQPCQPDIMVVDISLNGPDGLELLKNIRINVPILPVLILSMHDEVDLCGTRAARRRQRLHHEAGGHRESAGGPSPDSERRNLRQRTNRQSMLQQYVRGRSHAEQYCDIANLPTANWKCFG